MSEEKPVKITNATKIKDPRRVESGKRLGAISRDAKKRKADAAYTSEIPDESSTDSMELKEIGLMVSVIGILVGVAGLYYKFGKKSECTNGSPDEEQESEAKQDEKRETKTTSVDEEPKFKTNTKTKLDSLD